MAPSAADWPDLPLTLTELGSIVRAMKKRLPTSGTGSVVRRRLGHSLEYREHRAYTPGDDVRTIDWRASFRRGRPNEYLVRSYDAEEQFTLLVAIDVRPTMALPTAAPKLLFALWIAEALALVVSREKLRAGFASLYDRADAKVAIHTGNRILTGFRRFADVARARQGAPAPAEEIGSERLLKALPPASVLVVISDFYAESIDGYVRLIDKGRGGYRQVVVCELDTWPAEHALMSGNMVRFEGVGALAGPEGDFEPSPTELDAAGAVIARRRAELHARTRFGGVIHDRWEAPADLLADQAHAARLLVQSFKAWFPRFARHCELLARRG